MTCTRCNEAAAIENSDWCRGCWQAWWKSVEALSQLQRTAAARKARA